jgi:hypothetical protein
VFKEGPGLTVWFDPAMSVAGYGRRISLVVTTVPTTINTTQTKISK